MIFFIISKIVSFYDAAAMFVSCGGALVAFCCSFSKDPDVVSNGCVTGTGVAVMSGAYATYTSTKKYNSKIHAHSD